MVFTIPDGPVVLSTEANAEAKRQRASGDSRYSWWMQIDFLAQNGRVSQPTTYQTLYNLHGNYNMVFAGIHIRLSLLDKGNESCGERIDRGSFTCDKSARCRSKGTT
jgi:hypothetical protein